MRVTPWCLILLLPTCLPASAAVYRCVGEQGEPSFSRQPCENAAVMSVVDRPPPSRSTEVHGLRPSERAWLERRRAEKRSAAGSRRQPSGAAVSKSQRDRQAYQCRRKRRDLEALNAELRRGYKAARAPALHRRRQAYRDYLATFCS